MAVELVRLALSSVVGLALAGMEVAMEKDMFRKPRWSSTRKPSVQHLQETWEVMEFRASDAGAHFRPHRDLRPDLAFLAEQRFSASQNILRQTGGTYPLSPLLAAFVEEGWHHKVGREGGGRHVL